VNKKKKKKSLKRKAIVYRKVAYVKKKKNKSERLLFIEKVRTLVHTLNRKKFKTSAK